MRPPAVLFFDRDNCTILSAARALAAHGLRTVQAGDEQSARTLLQQGGVDAVVIGGLDDQRRAPCLIREFSERYGIPVFLFPVESSEQLAVAALRAGARDYVPQPNFEDLAAAVAAKCCTAVLSEGPEVVGVSSRMSQMRDYAAKVAASDCSVLITGETGTGKELVAQSIHANSSRRDHSFVALNCAAIPDTLLESELFGVERGAYTGAHAARSGKLSQASGGTIFFDEIGEMSLFAQAKLLRAIEQKEVQRLGGQRAIPVDVRVIAATNQNLEALVAANRFRADLYFRLEVANIQLPPLREHQEDIPALIKYFVATLNRQLRCRVEGANAAAMEPLMQYGWPGNVRELKNLLQAVFVTRTSGWITPEDLPERFKSRYAASCAAPLGERTKLICALTSTQWNKSEAAKALCWSRMTVYRKMAKYHISREILAAAAAG